MENVDAGDVRAMGYPPRAAADREWNQFKREKHVAVSKVASVEPSNHTGHGATGFGFALMDFGLALVQHLVNIP